MAFSGAIFDLDSTLVCSGIFWRGAVVDVLRELGARDPQALCRETDPYALPQKSVYLHKTYGLGVSAQEIHDKIFAVMADAYAHKVKIMPYARQFLDELRAHGVRMALATSTPRALVDIAFEALDLAPYFSVLVTGDKVARSKRFPDIYLSALRELGTSADETWVFEDALYGLASAHEAQLKTVGIFGLNRPEGTGTLEHELQTAADIFVHGYEELSFARIADFAAPTDAPTGTLEVLIVDGSPEPSSPALVAELAHAADYIIAADRGADRLVEAGVSCNVFCGDMDTVSPEAAEALAVQDRELTFPVDKYDTDLAFALACAEHEAARRNKQARVTLTCASGGRADHALGVVGLLARSAQLAPRVVEDAFEMRVLSPEGAASWRIAHASGQTFSVIALRERTVASEKGMRWNLDHRELALLTDVGISNRIVEDAAEVTCHAGVLACFLHARS
ncbi:MAG: thiamine diphosphokinase [Atopobiaceae bacterium]|jgi:thiamine pyrophosphokinase